METPSNHSSLYLAKMEQALAASGMSQTEFSYEHFKDPGILRRMRSGVRLQKKTIARINAVADLYELGKSS